MIAIRERVVNKTDMELLPEGLLSNRLGVWQENAPTLTEKKTNQSLKETRDQVLSRDDVNMHAYFICSLLFYIEITTLFQFTISFRFSSGVASFWPMTLLCGSYLAPCYSGSLLS